MSWRLEYLVAVWLIHCFFLVKVLCFANAIISDAWKGE